MKLCNASWLRSGSLVFELHFASSAAKHLAVSSVLVFVFVRLSCNFSSISDTSWPQSNFSYRVAANATMLSRILSLRRISESKSSSTTWKYII